MSTEQSEIQSAKALRAQNRELAKLEESVNEIQLGENTDRREHKRPIYKEIFSFWWTPLPEKDRMDEKEIESLQEELTGKLGWDIGSSQGQSYKNEYESFKEKITKLRQFLLEIDARGRSGPSGLDKPGMANDVGFGAGRIDIETLKAYRLIAELERQKLGPFACSNLDMNG